MNKRIEKWMNWTILIVLATQIVGAFAWIVLRFRYTDLIANATLTLEIEPASGTQLPHAHAEKRGVSCRIHGRIIVEPGAATDQEGAMLFVLVSPDERELARATADYRLCSRLSKGGGSFSIDLPVVPPKNSTVRISWKPTTKESSDYP